MQFDTINALKASPINPQPNELADVLGYTFAGDGGGGKFYWDPTPQNDFDDGTIFKRNDPNAIGRWKRLYSGPLNVKWFGAKGDGVIDDRAKIQNALNLHGEIIIPAGTYLIGAIDVHMYSATSITGIGNPLIRTAGRDGFTGTNVSDVYIEGLSFISDAQESSYRSLYFLNSSNIKVSRCNFIGGHNGLRTENSNFVTVTDCIGHSYTQWPIYIDGGEDISISNNTYYDNGKDGIKLGGREVPDPMNVIKNVIVSNNICYNNKSDGFDIAANQVENLLITGNNFCNNTLQGIDCKLVFQVGYMRNVSITNNLLKDNQNLQINCANNVPNNGNGVEFSVFISGNHISKSTISSEPSYLMLLAGCNKSRVISNTLSGSEYGIRVRGSQNLVISDNVIKLVRTYGIWVNNALDDEITDSVIIEKNTIETFNNSCILIGASEKVVGLHTNITIRDNTTECSAAAIDRIKNYISGILIYGNNSGARMVLPTSQATKGEIIYASDQISAGHIGWIAYADSAPGQSKFKPFGRIEYNPQYYTRYINYQTVDAVQQTAFTGVVPSDHTQTVAIQAFARTADYKTAYFKRTVVFSCEAGVARVVGQTESDTASDPALSAAGIIVDATQSSFRIRVTGIAATVVNWSFTVNKTGTDAFVPNI